MANHRTQWKPLVSINGTTKICNTYSEIKQNMKSLLKQCEGDIKIVRVYRSRRGEWGEWFEYWEYNSDGKPVITKQGWM